MSKSKYPKYFLLRESQEYTTIGLMEAALTQYENTNRYILRIYEEPKTIGLRFEIESETYIHDEKNNQWHRETEFYGNKINIYDESITGYCECVENNSSDSYTLFIDKLSKKYYITTNRIEKFEGKEEKISHIVSEGEIKEIKPLEF